MNDEAWFALAVALTVVGAGGSWWAFRNRGASTGLKLTALTFLVPAAYLTGTLELLGEVAMSVTDWATGFVFSLSTWIGVGIAGLAVLLFGISTKVGDGKRVVEPGSPGEQAPKQVRPGKPARSAAPVDPDMADIEALLKKRGIE
ncbi:hypothetical protein [Nocardioides alcanivorans]|uniref:hypothetical protein n=1 Tax=Nocardioides alcanivorans TaxID=2897352 RepID=UPI001F248F04|nr:hypothetical protein [Nocardioides alcanivorans]